VTGFTRDSGLSRPLLSAGPAATLVIPPAFLVHSRDHWLLDRPAGCEWCRDLICQGDQDRPREETL